MTGYPSSCEFIRLENVSKIFVEGGNIRSVLKDASACFNTGELAAIVGKSGSGKSTLLNLISGIDLVDSGRICIGGIDLTAMSERERTLFRRQKIGFVFQFFNLIPTLSVLENVTLPGDLSGRKETDVRRRAYELLGEVGLADRLDAFPDRLSGGEQQRVAIARSLVNDPLVVLADEPTGNLDEGTGRQVLELLDRLTRRAGKNMLMVTHSAEAAGIADRVLNLRDGKLLDEAF